LAPADKIMRPGISVQFLFAVFTDYYRREIPCNDNHV
jgi:hypothetical protein